MRRLSTEWFTLRDAAREVAWWLHAGAVVALASCASTPRVTLPPTPAITVTRAAFEDHLEMVLLDFGNGAHAAFNPRTASLDTVWRGSLSLRGKVFDFSQETSRALPLLGPTDMRVERTRPVEACNGATLDLTGTSDAWLWFEEQGRIPLKIELVDAQSEQPVGSFESATHVSSETDWQWNLKRLPRGHDRLRVTVHFPTPAMHAKAIRSMRLLVERAAWTGVGGPLIVRWRGYDIERDSSVRLRFDLIDAQGSVTQVAQRVRAVLPCGFESWYESAMPTTIHFDGSLPTPTTFSWERPS